MRKILASTGFALGAALAAPALAAEDCGRITIAEMNWASAGLAAWVDKIILEEGYGCEVDLVLGDTMPTFTSMNEKSEPDVAPEIWLNTIKDPLDQAVADGRMVIAGRLLIEGGVEGIYIPTWLAEEHGITTLKQALERPDLFPGAEDPTKGAYFGCPSGWACQNIARNQFLGAGGDEKGFALVDPGSAAGLDGSIARAFNRNEGWFGYYWAPTAILGKYDMTNLALEVEFDHDQWHKCIVTADCLDPQLTGWPTSEVFTVVTKDFADKGGVAMEYFETRGWNNDTVNKVLAWMGEKQATNEDGAYEFLLSHEDVWTQWVPADVAEKVKSAL